MRKVLLIAFLFSLLSTVVFAESLKNELFVKIEENKALLVGQGAGEQLGAAIVVGDFNGDGVDDLAVGSPFASKLDKRWTGGVSLYFGGASVRGELSPSVVIKGAYEGDQMGTSLAAGDFNADGVDDLAIGAYNGSLGAKRPGKVYVLDGRSEWSGEIDFSQKQSSLLLLGQGEGDGFGLAMTAGDVNGDGIEDLLVGAPFALLVDTGNTGSVSAFFGGVDKMSTGVDMVFYGQNEGERFGSAISVGDINGDGAGDLVIGAHRAPVLEVEQAGRVYLYDGEEVALGEVRRVVPSNYIVGTVKKGWFGFSVDTGDINADGMEDIAIGSFSYAGNRARARVSAFNGAADIFEQSSVYDHKVQREFMVQDSAEESLLGASVVIDDLNLDGKSEVLVGAPGVGAPFSIEEGDVHVVYNTGGGNVFSVIHGENADDWFGYSLATADFNVDGFRDIVVGARYAEGLNGVNNGKVYVVFGDGTPIGEPSSGDGFRNFVRRDVFVKKVVESFDIRTKKADFIDSCYQFKEFCLFNFIAASSFKGLDLGDQIRLYPDVKPENQYYEEINIATMLGLINGHLNRENSPFSPDEAVSRIQALKVVLSAGELVPSKYRFELREELGSDEAIESQFSYFTDVDARLSHMWWYPRYVNFAVENGILDEGEEFRPDEDITMLELNDMVERTLKLINSDAETGT